MKRLFVAAILSPELKEKIFENYGKKLPKTGLKIVEKENLHITLKFLGHLDEKNEHHVKTQMKKISAKKFQLTLGTTGEFGGRVIWIGLIDREKNLQNISEQLDSLLGLHDEKFHPHITIARNKSLNKIEIKKTVRTLNTQKKEEKFAVKNIDLMESELQKSRPVYKMVFEKKLE